MNNICPQLNTNYNELKKLKDEFFSVWDGQEIKDVEKAFEIKQAILSLENEIEEKIEKEFFDIPYAEGCKKEYVKNNLKRPDKIFSKYKILKMIKADKNSHKIVHEAYDQNNVLISLEIFDNLSNSYSYELYGVMFDVLSDDEIEAPIINYSFTEQEDDGHRGISYIDHTNPMYRYQVDKWFYNKNYDKYWEIPEWSVWDGDRNVI